MKNFDGTAQRTIVRGSFGTAELASSAEFLAEQPLPFSAPH